MESIIRLYSFWIQRVFLCEYSILQQMNNIYHDIIIPINTTFISFTLYYKSFICNIIQFFSNHASRIYCCVGAKFLNVPDKSQHHIISRGFFNLFSISHIEFVELILSSISCISYNLRAIQIRHIDLSSQRTM